MENSTKTFKFYIPADVLKASKDNDGRRVIQGIASTNHKDLQGETIDQDGLDLSYFILHGNINNDHLKGPENIVGEPLEAKITKDGFWLKALIYKNKIGNDWWDHIQSLETSGSKRKVGFSVEGKVTSKSGSNIKACYITAVAITSSPVNTKTWASIAKSLEGTSIVEGDPEEDQEEKALTAGSSDGMALMPESLDGKMKVTSYKSIKDVPHDVELTKSEYVTVLQLGEGYSKATAEAVVDAIFLTKGIGLEI
ncbi:MAG: hypothetical protein L3J47_00535 [Sulfurovum sp.]|nr:hypothetical protein [Sulfurovum sp.]